MGLRAAMEAERARVNGAPRSAAFAATEPLVIDQSNAQMATPSAVDAAAPRIPVTDHLIVKNDPQPLSRGLTQAMEAFADDDVDTVDLARRITKLETMHPSDPSLWEKDIEDRIAFLEDAREQDEALVRANAAQTGTTWPDLISRWTSRTWLLPFLSGVTTVATTVGATLGALDPRIAAGSAAVTALFGSLFIAFEKIGDNAVRVAAAQKAPTVHAE